MTVPEQEVTDRSRIWFCESCREGILRQRQQMDMVEVNLHEILPLIEVGLVRIDPFSLLNLLNRSMQGIPITIRIPRELAI